MQPLLTSYDSVAYPSYTHPQTHPDRLAVVGAIFGMEPAPTNRCRVLEIACGDGANLAPMAWSLPSSEFFGIDLAAKAVARGQVMLDELGMKNIRLVQGDVMELGPDLGKFDYILVHGLYSWVSPPVQSRVLEIARAHLKPQGIAFISYNALPGCHLRGMLREMLLFHVRGFDSPDERVKQATAFTRFLADAQDSRDEYRQWMKAELDTILERDDGHLYHDELAEVNDPRYFTRFMQEASSHDLQYLGEADYFEMSDHVFNESTRATLRQLTPNRILREQYLDFLKCRRFRQTLLCHADVTLQTEPQIDRIAAFHVSSAAACSGPVDFRPAVTCTFEAPKGAKATTDFPLGKAALSVLQTAWPATVPFDELLTSANTLLANQQIPTKADAPARHSLCGFLHQLYSAGVIELRTGAPATARGVSDRPVVNPIARWQARRGNVVTSLFHVAVKVEDEVGRQLLCWLDGSLDRAALLEKLWQLLESKKTVAANAADGDKARQEIASKLEENLEKLARLGLLSA